MHYQPNYKHLGYAKFIPVIFRQLLIASVDTHCIGTVQHPYISLLSRRTHIKILDRRLQEKVLLCMEIYTRQIKDEREREREREKEGERA